jgi:DNA repair photolyase
MLKESHGNMYDWVTHMHTHLRGKCSHECSYCYVQRNRFGTPKRYTGAPALDQWELDVDYGMNRTIFIEHMNDMFADSIKDAWICAILDHCVRYDKNTYVFQTKNPERALEFISHFPSSYMIGTTIESNLNVFAVSKAPLVEDRAHGIWMFADRCPTFITIEPIMQFTGAFAKMIIDARPTFVNIGADSKRSLLPEPSQKEVMELAKRLQSHGVEIKKKINLDRLLK